MNFRLAEIGIVLVVTYNIFLPFIPFVNSLFSYIFWDLIGNTTTIYSIDCTVTGIGLTLFILGRKDFLRRMKGNKLVSMLLVIFGLLLIGWGLFFAYLGFFFSLIGAWAGLMLISGILWIVYGFRMWRYDEFQPLRQESE